MSFTTEKFRQFCQEVYFDMPKPIQTYFRMTEKLWKVAKPFAISTFWYLISIMVFYYVYKTRGFETTIIVLFVSLLYTLRRQK